MTTVIWPEQTIESSKEASITTMDSLQRQLEAKNASMSIMLLGPAYDMFGPILFDCHLPVKEMKKTFDPNNIANPPYTTTPEVISPEELEAMTKAL